MRLSPAWLGTGAVHVYLGLQALTPGGGTQPSLEFSGSGLLSQVQSAPYTFFSINSLVHCANRSFRQRDPVDLVLEDARHASVDLWRDPNHPFRPSTQRAQFEYFGVRRVVAAGAEERETRRVVDLRFAAVVREQAAGLDRELPRVGSVLYTCTRLHRMRRRFNQFWSSSPSSTRRFSSFMPRFASRALGEL